MICDYIKIITSPPTTLNNRVFSWLLMGFLEIKLSIVQSPLKWWPQRVSLSPVNLHLSCNNLSKQFKSVHTMVYISAFTSGKPISVGILCILQFLQILPSDLSSLMAITKSLVFTFFSLFSLCILVQEVVMFFNVLNVISKARGLPVSQYFYFKSLNFDSLLSGQY